MKKPRVQRLFILVILFFLSGSYIFANHFWGSLSLGLMSPSGEFGGNVEGKVRVVPAFTFGYKPGKLPFVFELSFEYALYGNEKRIHTTFIPEFGDVFLDIHTQHTLCRGQIKLKFIPVQRGGIRPYIDLMAGLNFLASSASITGEYNDETDSYDNIVYSSLSNDSAPLFGVGAGVLIRVGATKNRHKEGYSYQHFINVGVHYIWGEKAEYMKEGSTVIEDDVANYTSYNTAINTLTFSIGYTISFL